MAFDQEEIQNKDTPTEPVVKSLGTLIREYADSKTAPNLMRQIALGPDMLTEEEQKYVIGTQLNLWTEYVAAPQHLFYMLLPRLDAISEVQWCLPEQKDFENFKTRLQHIMKLYDCLGISYCPSIE